MKTWEERKIASWTYIYIITKSSQAYASNLSSDNEQQNQHGWDRHEGRGSHDCCPLLVPLPWLVSAARSRSRSRSRRRRRGRRRSGWPRIATDSDCYFLTWWVIRFSRIEVSEYIHSSSLGRECVWCEQRKSEPPTTAKQSSCIKAVISKSFTCAILINSHLRSSIPTYTWELSKCVKPPVRREGPLSVWY
jgi:hypothetical protein